MIPLTDLEEGVTGKVVEITGGKGIHQQVDALGIRIDTEIKKMSSMVLRGPVIVLVGNMRVAIGRGKAQSIMVEPSK